VLNSSKMSIFDKSSKMVIFDKSSKMVIFDKSSKMSIFDLFIALIYRPHKFDGGFMGHVWAWLLN
jgi:hypothetical protein